MLFWYPKLYFDIRTVSENRNFCHSKSDFDIRTESENAILTFKILFWHLNWVGKCNLIFKFLFWHSIWVEKWYFDILNPNFNIRTESENAILIFKILFWHSNWVGTSYFLVQYPIFTFQLNRKIVFWHSISYFDIRTESENSILILKILFWHSNWVGKSHFDIQKIPFWYSNWVGKWNFDIQNPILTFEPSLKIVFWQSKSYFNIRSVSENAILIFKILLWHSNRVSK